VYAYEAVPVIVFHSFPKINSVLAILAVMGHSVVFIQALQYDSKRIYKTGNVRIT
jgi:hypothetical protein